MKYMRKVEAHVQLKPGIYGVKVRIMPPEARFPDQVQIVEKGVEEAKEAESATVEAEKAEEVEE